MLKNISDEILDMLPRARAIFNSLEDPPMPTGAVARIKRCVNIG